MKKPTFGSILKSNMKENSNKITVRFRKTINIKPYETEVVEAENEVAFDNDLSGAERMLICTILQAELEIHIYNNLYYKGQISKEEFGNKVDMLSKSIKDVKIMAEKALGKSLDNYLDSLEEHINGIDQ